MGSPDDGRGTLSRFAGRTGRRRVGLKNPLVVRRPAKLVPGTRFAAGMPADKSADGRSSHDATIVLPTLNEEVGLARTLEELPLDHLYLAGFRTQVVVVDGGSTDGTVEVARRYGVPVLRQTGRGKGNAVRQALTTAIDRGSEFVTVIDADHSYGAETLLPVFSLLAAGTDLVIGARRPLHDPAETFRSVVHRVGDALLSITAARLSRVPFVDVCSGLWGVRIDAVRHVPLESEEFEIESELFLKMARHGFRVSQVPVTYRPRIGRAKLRAVRDGARILLTILRYSRAPVAAGTSVNLRYLPDETPTPDLRPSQDWLRVVQSLCFSVSPPRLSIVADSERAEEARELARRLWAGKIRVTLTVSGETRPRGPSRDVGVPDGGPTVRLPALVDATSLAATAIVDLPESDRVLYIPRPSDAVPRSPDLSRSGAYRILRPLGTPTPMVTNLAAAVYGSAAARSDALLRATTGNLGLRSSPYPTPEERLSASVATKARHTPVLSETDQ